MHTKPLTCFCRLLFDIMPLHRSVLPKNIFISQPPHMLWVLKDETVLVLFNLILYVMVKFFQSCWDGSFSTKQRIKCLAQGHNTVATDGVEPATRVKYSTEPPPTPQQFFQMFKLMNKKLFTVLCYLFTSHIETTASQMFYELSRHFEPSMFELSKLFFYRYDSVLPCFGSVCVWQQECSSLRWFLV